MKETRELMGMPITIEIVDKNVRVADFTVLFHFFTLVDTIFSTYRDDSEISKINNGLLHEEIYSNQMKLILSLAEKTRTQTNGYFNIKRSDGSIEPAGIVKGWAIHQVAQLAAERGFHNYYIDAGGDIEVSGRNKDGKVWRIGIRNPFRREEIIKVLYIKNKGVATSGTYIRGNHIYDPHQGNKAVNEIISLTVIGPDIYEADRFATAAFAMGKEGITFIEKLPDFEGYLIDIRGIATFTRGFQQYTVNPDLTTSSS